MTLISVDIITKLLLMNYQRHLTFEWHVRLAQWHETFEMLHSIYLTFNFVQECLPSALLQWIGYSLSIQVQHSVVPFWKILRMWIFESQIVLVLVDSFSPLIIDLCRWKSHMLKLTDSWDELTLWSSWGKRLSHIGKNRSWKDVDQDTTLWWLVITLEPDDWKHGFKHDTT